ncbi:hypothetical protein B0H16DRAFT_1903439 [Mycena metata]|uniref:Uncharacterized protein n=1 Tax=Mycena metata TaxID=1033252 RepID=A0AAD7DSK6_9AGAR|nr:hypothetical protein B0H16DRAFT_1903439 [Mycena metata]
MPPKHTPDDTKLIEGLPMGVITAFRRSIYVDGFVIANPLLFIGNEWIDATQLRVFLQHSGTHRAETPSPPIKIESETLPTRLGTANPVLLEKAVVKTRIRTEGTREVVEILSDSDEASDSEDFEVRGHGPRVSSPLPPSDIPTESSDMVSDLDAESSSDELDIEPELMQSETRWLDPEISSRVRVGEFRVTMDVTVQRVEYLTGFPSLYPIPSTPTAFVIDAQDPRFDITKKGGGLHTVDALIKNKDNDSWTGNTGTGDSKVAVHFEVGKPAILCRRSRLGCKGAFVCEQVDDHLLDVERRDLDPASRDAVFAAQRQTRRDDGTTAERKVTEFLQLVRSQKCRAVDKNGRKCQGVAILRSKKQVSRGHHHFLGCSGYRADFTNGHRSTSIPDDVDKDMLIRGLSGAPLVAGSSKDTGPCSAIVHPTTGLKQQRCPHSHIVNGTAIISRIVNRPCHAMRTIYVPVDASIRKALIIHPRNLAHNHPMPALKKPSLEAKESYRRCIRAVGCVGATVSKVDNAPSTQLLLDGKKPGEFAPALHSNQIKRKLVREAKMEAYPAGLDLAGAFQLFRDDLKKPVDERYIQRLVTMPDGGVIILTCLTALIELLDDMGVTSFETDTTFKRVEGEINEWEVVIFLKSLQRAVTIARAYVNGASIVFFERLYDEFRSLKVDLTGKPVAFKCFFAGGNLLALNSDMEAAQVLGATLSFMKANNPDYSGISRDTPAERVAPKFIKLCTTHGKRAVLDFRSLVSESEYQHLIDFPYIESEEDLNEFSEFVRGLGIKKIQDWWDHKAMSAWILPCLVKSQSPMSAEDWDNTPATTNTGEAQHHWTNSRTGIKLSLVEAIESARKVDEGVVREIELSRNSGILVNGHNESYHRRVRNSTRQSTAMHKAHESSVHAEERAQLEADIAAEKEVQKATAARLKDLNARKSAYHKSRARRPVAGSSSSGRVTSRTRVSAPHQSTNVQAEPPSPAPVASISSVSAPLQSTNIQSEPPLPALFASFSSGSNPLQSINSVQHLGSQAATESWAPAIASAGHDDGIINNQFSDFNFDFFVPASTAPSGGFAFDPFAANIDPTWFLSADTSSMALQPDLMDYNYLLGADLSSPLPPSPSNGLRLPTVPVSSPSPPSPEPAPAAPVSKKRKAQDEVDPADILDKSVRRTRKAPKLFTL